MNIYIKTFNRPFYLDRCIRSIIFNLTGYNKIIVLDDGTLDKYKEKLYKLYPSVEFRHSGADDEKFNMLKEEKFDEIAKTYIEPSRFWVNEIEKDEGEFIMVLEDDTWVVNQMDLAALQSNMIANKCVLTKAWWDGVKTTERNYLNYSLRDGSMLCYYNPDIKKDLVTLYDLWIICMAVYKKEYFINCFSNLKRLGDEHTQLLRAFDYYKANPGITYARTLQRICFQGWATPGRATSEYYDKGLRFHKYMESLNETWYKDRMDVTENYPFDFSDGYILSIFSHDLSTNDRNVWMDWKAHTIKYEYD